MNVFLILLAIVVAVIGAIILIYNGLVMKRQRVNQAFADVDVQLKQRQNLIPNLVETVKGYASHEQETLQQVIAARNAAQAASTAGDMARAEGVLTQALGKLFALAESYPDLKANTNFLQLQQQLSSIEDKLAAARRFYNSAVQDYNTAREQFPGSIIAGSFNFESREFFDVGAEGRAAMDEPPKVSF
ncbi:LemA family protein [Hyphomonas sp. WL0036]|uniref:LemA family protein n=1 Tax=Hyphomonas sediminis TaxID=2866160 RepID=UPI001C7F378E|nr:LemA family protein [Hyphomonas sediminis]MBY9068387.1 LemA family protein [Hyphomonas sediminis]